MMPSPTTTNNNSTSTDLNTITMFRRRFKRKENRSSAVYSEDEATRNANSKNKRWFKNDLSEVSY